MAEETVDSAAAPPAKGGNTLVIVLLAVNMLLVAAVLALFFLKGAPGAAAAKAEGHGDARAETHGEAKAEGGAEEGPAGAGASTVKMGDFVVHLRDAEMDRYARISFEVELTGEADRARFERYTARVRDGFIAYLSDRTLEDLRGSDQVRKQKAALQEQLKELAPGVRVRGLYITDLVIQ